MPATYAGFGDVGYIHEEGAKALGNAPSAMRAMAAAVVAWFRGLSAGELAGQSLEWVY